jgi:ubiquinone/menaquinone biosynthesis C-methylase UbiE
MAAVSHPIFARVYERVSVTMDRAGVAEQRRTLAAGLSGRVIEVGAGNGRQFAHYPPAVTEVVAVEPEPRLRAAAVRAAAEAPVPVRVVDALAEDLPGADGEYDAAVVALVLCSVDDQGPALSEIHRVLRPGGQLRFLEHVAAPEPGMLRRVQRVVDATVWPRLFAGCHTGRDTVAAIERAGFVLERVDRFFFPAEGPRGPAAPIVLGTAIRPAAPGSAATGTAAPGADLPGSTPSRTVPGGVEDQR